MTPNTRAFVIPIAQAFLIGLVFVGVLLLGYRSPSPHELKVDAVGSAGSVTRLNRALEQEVPGQIQLQRVSETTAFQQLRSGDTFGVISLGSRPQLSYAGANGPTVTATLEGVLGSAVSTERSPLKSRDVLPEIPDDSAGLPLFYLVFGVVLASYLYGIASFAMGRTTSTRSHLLGALTIAALLGTGGALIARYGTRSLLAHTPHVALLLALASMAVSSTTYLCLRASSLLGNLVSTILIIVLGSASGGVLAAPFLPSWLADLRPVLQMGATLDGIRRVVYFGNTTPFVAIGVLVAWAVIPQIIVGLMDARSRKKSTPAEPAQSAPPAQIESAT